MMAEFLKWMEAGEESIFSLETEKTCQVHPTHCSRGQDKKIPRIRIFPTACRIPVWSFVVIVKAEQRTRLKTI